MPGGDTYERLMRDKYGVTVSEAGCVITEATIRYIRAYNWYSERRLQARFGRDVSAECEEAAFAAARR